ncbi:hypothetical protein MLD38_037486 [Melastoma candidum]|uniref:Uncharacterized protein n=1 Tax=Melastoma candidum TaxID=119954 RepID=A0ACB9LMH3_9MYRT|nr:hypothetical protein MLD38_037486 [Melastoma candidum]
MAMASASSTPSSSTSAPSVSDTIPSTSPARTTVSSRPPTMASWPTSLSGSRRRPLGFFSLLQPEKDASGPANPFGYGSKMIGRNGDIGWVEYLLFSTNPEVDSAAQPSVLLRNQLIFRSAVEVQNLTCCVLDLISASLGIEPRDRISSMLRDEQSDSFFRVNHYPPSRPRATVCCQTIGCGSLLSTSSSRCSQNTASPSTRPSSSLQSSRTN